jgi:PEGA domain-containing protein
LEPMPVPVPVELRSEPPGARVIIDGKQLDKPTNGLFTFDWFSGTPPRKAEFLLNGYKPAQKMFTRDDQSVSIVLEIEESPLSLKVETVPAGADIEVEEKFVGSAPREITLVWSVVRNYYKVRISRPGYESKEEIITKDRLKQPLKVRLKPLLPKLP